MCFEAFKVVPYYLEELPFFWLLSKDRDCLRMTQAPSLAALLQPALYPTANVKQVSSSCRALLPRHSCHTALAG